MFSLNTNERAKLIPTEVNLLISWWAFVSFIYIIYNCLLFHEPIGLVISSNTLVHKQVVISLHTLLEFLYIPFMHAILYINYH